MSNTIKKLYREQGYIYIPNLLDTKDLIRVEEVIAKTPPKLKLQDNVTPWGYGNLIDQLSFILKKDKLEILNSILGEDFIFNHLLVNNKAAFIGPPVEWHQEFSLVNTYAAGYSEKDFEDFAQIYIAIDDHTDVNGCLRIFPGSHKLGLLPHEDIIGYNFNHKKQISREQLLTLSKTHPVQSIKMNRGDCLIFNHLLVHGSGSNTDNADRKAIILQARRDTKPIDIDLFEEYSNFRIKYAVDFYKEKIGSLQEKNMYKDFVGYDKKSKK